MEPTGEGQPKKIRILIVDDNATTADSVTRLLKFESDLEVIGWAANGRQGIQKAQELGPDIVLMDINMPDLDGIEACRQIGLVSPRSRVAMMSVQGDMAYFKRAMNVGAREFLTKPFDCDDLVRTIRRVAAADPTPWELTAEAELMVSESTNGKGPKEPARTHGILIAVFGPKGGIGCSTVAANLAIALRGNRQADVLLVDADLLFGDLDALLDLRPPHRLVDVLEMEDLEEVDLIKRMEAGHYSGIRLLAGPARPEMAELVHVERFQLLLHALRNVHDYLVVDLGSRYTELTKQVLQVADRVVWLVTPEVTTIKNSHLLLTGRDLIDFAPDKVVAIMNKYSDSWGVTPEAVAKAIGRPVALLVPDDEPSAVRAVNQGRPVLLSSPRSPMVKSLLALERLMPDMAQLVRNAEPLPLRASEAAPVTAVELTLLEQIVAWLRRLNWSRWFPFVQIPSLMKRFGF